MRYLTLAEVLDLHARVGAATGGASALRDLAALESALAQPRQTFGEADLYPDLPAKAAALAFGLIRGHAVVDGNKRIGHAAMVVFLLLNGLELQAGIADAEHVIVAVAASTAGRTELEGGRDRLRG